MIPIQIGTKSVYTEYITLALRRAGFYSRISDEYDMSVQEAVKNFQQSRGLEADGIVGERTYSALLPYLEGYVRIIAGEGETVQSIADKYGTTTQAVRIANPDIDMQNLSGTVVTVPFGFDVVPSDVNYTYYLTEIISRGLGARYPFIKVYSIGLSLMGKDLTCLEMGNGKTEVFFNGTHHANEWITTPLLFKYTEDYAKAYTEDARIEGISARKLFEEKKLYVVPLVNPDGMDLVNGGMADTKYLELTKAISADYPSIPYPDGWKANIAGTDPNLNYPAGWLNARDIKFAQGYVSPAPRDFVGIAPLSAPESRAVHDFTLDKNFALTLSYHTQGEVIYWKYLDFEPANSRAIGEELSRVSGYTLELTPSASGYAGYKDWFILNYNRPGYTIEVGTGQNPLPISQFDEIYRANKPLMTTALNLAVY